MEFWPADFRNDIPSTSTKKRSKGKATYVNERGLESGSLGAATLISERGHLKWITAAQPHREHIPQVVGKPLEVFPATKSLPPSLPRLSVHQRAEQGARFLRTYHPDVDIPFELIKDELLSDEEEAVADAALDPYAGNRLAHSSFENKGKQRIHFLSFSSGETGSDLNVSPFRVTREKQVVFSPSAAPTLSFDTPIQQIVPFSSRSEVCHSFSLLAVRSHATVSLVKLQDSSPVQWERPSLTAKLAGRISLSDTGGRRIVDVSGCIFSSSDAQALIVNDMGAVYNCKVEGEKIVTAALNIRETQPPEADQFWRVARRDVNTGLLSSSQTVQLLDMRAHIPTVIFDMKKEKEFLTSIEAPSQGGHLMCFSTTKKLVWIDERNQKRPVLSVCHHRAFDRTLRAETVTYGPSPLTMLLSSANSLVTVYDVNNGLSGYTYMFGGPTIVSGSHLVDIPLGGSTFVRHTAEKSPTFDLFQLSSRGSIWRRKVVYSHESEIGVVHSQEGVEWTEDMHALVEKSMMEPERIPPLGGREHIDANLRRAYEKIFDICENASEAILVDGEAVYQTLEKMPSIWQEDGPAEHMLLTFDVALRSGMEPSHASRADFLTGSLLSSPQGFFALTRERVPIPRLISTARWHYDLKSLPSVMVPNIATIPQVFIDQCRAEALGHAATSQGMTRAIDATKHVALDLALSRHVYSPQSFSEQHIASSNDVDDSNLLSKATKAMSLEVPEPSPVLFGFLRPVTKLPYKEDERMEDSDPVGAQLALGVRLLLSQWEVGTDPQKYLYEDPYDAPEAKAQLQKPTMAKMMGPADGQEHTIPPIISFQRVPPVVSSMPRPLETTGPSVRTNSMFQVGRGLTSDTFLNNARLVSSQEVNRPSTSLQEEGPSTQPLPGAFGGGRRPQKNKKKRIGGF